MKLITRVVLLATVLVLPGLASAGTYVSVTIAPPPLPVYAQPICPGDGYIWTPGYWAWDGVEYYWVPGTWVLAPAVDVFWTPGYWGWGGGYYAWHAGYWGPHVGFYGGVNYGYGYGGVGYQGGRWEGGSFHYNRAVNNVNGVNIHNTYNTTIVNNNNSHVSFNGGDHGVRAQPNAQEIAAARDHHVGPTSVQKQHVQAARNDGSLRFSQNHGNPSNAATSRPFSAGKASADHGSPGNGNGNGHVTRAPDASSRPAQQGHMPSSGFAPHADRGQVTQPHASSENASPRVNGTVSNRAETQHGGGMPSSSFAPRERPQNAGGMPQGARPEAPHMQAPGGMNAPARQQPHMGGGEARPNPGPRPQGGGEHRRE